MGTKGADKLSILVPGLKETKLKDLLPSSFGPSNLKINISLYDDRHNNMVLKTENNDAIVKDVISSIAPNATLKSYEAVWSLMP